jgi:predicted tellurium resistance membrane protein TerC
MAVVFISPKQKQKVFFTGITLALLLFLAIAYVGIFLSKPKTTSSAPAISSSGIVVDTSIFSSSQFKQLVPFTDLEMQYSYKATTKGNQVETGFISAISENQARDTLTSEGLTVVTITEAQVGRDNPFEPYYTTEESSTTSPVVSAPVVAPVPTIGSASPVVQAP